MKKQILPFLFVLSAILLISTSAMAANDLTPEVGQVETYNVVSVNGAAGGSYEWKITGGSAGTDYLVTGGALGTTATNTITWLKPGTYDFSVVWTDYNGCLSEPATWSVVVAAPTVVFSTPIAERGITCSYRNASSGNGTTPAHDTQSFTVQYSGGTPSITLTYEIWDITSKVAVGGANLEAQSNGTGGTQVGASRTQTFTSGDLTSLSGLLNVAINSDFQNTTAETKYYEVRLVSAVDANAVSVIKGTAFYTTISIYEKPTLSFN